MGGVLVEPHVWEVWRVPIRIRNGNGVHGGKAVPRGVDAVGLQLDVHRVAAVGQLHAVVAVEAGIGAEAVLVDEEVAHEPEVGEGPRAGGLSRHSHRVVIGWVSIDDWRGRQNRRVVQIEAVDVVHVLQVLARHHDHNGLSLHERPSAVGIEAFDIPLSCLEDVPLLEVAAQGQVVWTAPFARTPAFLPDAQDEPTLGLVAQVIRRVQDDDATIPTLRRGPTQ